MQAILSAQRALHGLTGEIIVVDNCSTDGSVALLQEKFGDQILLIANSDNPGFSKANNQGIKIARGRYILLLNPDTLVAEDCFEKCIRFMDNTPRAGALGVKMIDGLGEFLPESKRALPTPWVSFYKIFGLSSLFPRSTRFARYHLSYLDKNQNHPIEILSGAFMFMRKEMLDKIGWLDEQFFMYGEDVDLSYRSILGGYENYYLAETTLLHYKGESTKKGSLNYVKVFYQAMILFARKHFSGRYKQNFILAIHLAVYVRALGAILYRLYKRFRLQVLEGGLIFGILYGVKSYWEHYVKYIEGANGSYPAIFSQVYLPVYTLVFVFFLWLMGAYKKPYRLRSLILAPVWGFIAIATATYSFGFILNFSRAIVGLSAVFTMPTAMAIRGWIHLRAGGSFFLTETRKKRIAIVGTSPACNRITEAGFLQKNTSLQVIGSVIMDEGGSMNNYLGTYKNLKELTALYQLEELIIANEAIPTSEVIAMIAKWGKTHLACKIVPPLENFAVGPQEVYTSVIDQDTMGALFTLESKKDKRIFDALASGILLALFPFLGWFMRKPFAAFLQLLNVLLGQKSLIGYAFRKDLPRMGRFVLSVTEVLSQQINADSKAADAWLRHYIQSYHWTMDLNILRKAWKNLS